MYSNRFDFLKVKISAENLETAAEKIKSYPFLKSNYICFPDASVIKSANEDSELLNILNNSYLTLPDGKPSQLAARLQGFNTVSTVSGYSLLKELLNSNLTHYFYGSEEAVLEKVVNNLRREFPLGKILGYSSPPFVPISGIKSNPNIQSQLKDIAELKPDIVWIGISSPKQDYLMSNYYSYFENSLMIGVGGVFLYLSDESLKSPEWIKKIGMRWAYRLLKEPKRLWRKYFETIIFLFKNSSFFIKAYSNRPPKI